MGIKERLCVNAQILESIMSIGSAGHHTPGEAKRLNRVARSIVDREINELELIELDALWDAKKNPAKRPTGGKEWFK